MMRSRRALLLGTACAALLCAPRADAQVSCQTQGNASGRQCTVSLPWSISIPKLAELVVSSGNPISLAPAGGTISAADYAAGSYDVGTPLTVTARANSTWSATFRATGSSFVGSGCTAKAIGDLRWGRTSTTRTTPLTTTATQIFTSSTNAATAGTAQSLFFNVALTWTGDAPGTCTVPLSFTITAP